MQVTARPDVLSILRSSGRSQWQPWILEVKVSKADFQRDVAEPLKRYSYSLLAERVFYVCPAGLIAEIDVPAGCGLVVELKVGTFSIEKMPAVCKPARYAHINSLIRGA